MALSTDPAIRKRQLANLQRGTQKKPRVPMSERFRADKVAYLRGIGWDGRDDLPLFGRYVWFLHKYEKTENVTERLNLDKRIQEIEVELGVTARGMGATKAGHNRGPNFLDRETGLKRIWFVGRSHGLPGVIGSVFGLAVSEYEQAHGPVVLTDPAPPEAEPEPYTPEFEALRAIDETEEDE